MGWKIKDEVFTGNDIEQSGEFDWPVTLSGSAISNSITFSQKGANSVQSITLNVDFLRGLISELKGRGISL
jgi:hypothetical protein